ncbi:MAG: aldehyde dehydrogenase [Flavobacteriales bacterium]|jgi:aminomuconate-semialdehyde/2-hydroxymuconate-6-semialdehyde dehydrogenase|nr:aldehyde dehydrogenase [Flavobacteriales bacterium]
MKILNYIDGTHFPAESNEWLENVNPATGSVFSQIASSHKPDVEKAYQAAEKAFPVWSGMSKQERSEILLKISQGITENLEELALAESTDNGKPLKLAKSVDIPRAASNMAFFATAILHDSQKAYEMDGLAINYTQRKPLGVVGCISPWNLPLYLFTWKIAPALAAGNCVVAKPSEVTPYTAFLFSKICQEAGLPVGVLNIVHGLGPNVGQAIVEHPNIKAISFTGGTKTGEQIAKIAAPMFKKLSLELGGKNPVMVFDDCDFDQMIKGVVRSSFANQGQICLCGSRIYVQKGIYDRFIQAFLERVKKLKVGNPLAEDTKVGALVSEPHLEKVMSYIELAQEEGGEILHGGNRVYPEGFEKGFYLEPTVIAELNTCDRVNQEEIFGPVVSIIPFENDTDVLAQANDTQYGLTAVLWTQDLTRAHQLAHQLDTGIVWINTWLLRDLRTPFGGAKNSGVGREGGFKALHFFTEEKNICIRI